MIFDNLRYQDLLIYTPYNRVFRRLIVDNAGAERLVF